MKLYIAALATTLAVFSGSVLADVTNGTQNSAADTQNTATSTGNTGSGTPNNWTPNMNNVAMPWNNSNGQNFKMPWSNGNTQGFNMPWGNGNNTQNYPMQMPMQVPQMPMTNYFTPQQVQSLMMEQQTRFRVQQQAQYQIFMKQIRAMQAQSTKPVVSATSSTPTTESKVVAPTPTAPTATLIMPKIEIPAPVMPEAPVVPTPASK